MRHFAWGYTCLPQDHTQNVHRTDWRPFGCIHCIGLPSDELVFYNKAIERSNHGDLRILLALSIVLQHIVWNMYNHCLSGIGYIFVWWYCTSHPFHNQNHADNQYIDLLQDHRSDLLHNQM